MPFASKDSPLKNNRDALTTISVSNVENPDTPPQNTEPFCKQDKAIHSHFHPNWRNAQQQWLHHHQKNLHYGFLKRGTSQIQGTPEACKINHVVVGGQQYRQIWIPSYILRTLHAHDIYTRTFIDCGANINCINYNFTQRIRIPLRQLKKPLLVNNVDGSLNEAGTI